MTHLIKSFAKPNNGDSVVSFASLDATAKELLVSAYAVRKCAYAPYSGFKVGAAFRAANNNAVYTGCNVENAAFSPTNCAERTALCTAVSEGVREFSAGAVVAYQPDVFTTPCGVCRQFIREFCNDDIAIYVAQAHADRTTAQAFHDDDPVLCTSIFNLLPSSFHTYQKV